MESRSTSMLKCFLRRLFIDRNTLPPYLQIIQTCVESVLYIAVINGFILPKVLFPSSPSDTNIVIALLLGGTLLARVISGHSLIKFVYIPILTYVIPTLSSSAASMVFMFITGLLLVADIVSSVAFDFYSENLSSESLNICKLLHFSGIILGIFQTLLTNGYSLDGVCAGLMTGLWLAKRASICRSHGFKKLQLYIYLWMAVTHLTVMITYWITMPLFFQLGVPLLLTQLIMKGYLNRRGYSKLEELYSQENYLKVAFQLMVYLHSEQFSASMEKQIQAFLADTQYSSLKEEEKQRVVYKQLIELLSRRNSYQEQLIAAQIFLFFDHQLLSSKTILTKISSRLHWWELFQRICLYRVGETLREMYELKNHQIHFAHYEQYFLCDRFRILVLRAAIAFAALWEGTRQPEIESEKLRNLADRLVDLERRLKRDFFSIEPRCLTLSLLYVSYLLEVARDSVQANAILETLAFNEDFEVNLEVDEKVFVEIGLEGEGVVIRKVGHNVSLLLGFERKELEGQGLDLLLPEFYRKFHVSSLEKSLQQDFSRLYLFGKKTITRCRQGYYQECNVMLRLHLGPSQQLLLWGYLHLKPNAAYSWPHFVFIAQNEQILECGQSLSGYAPSLTRLHKASEIFQEVKLFQPLQQVTGEAIYEYHPLLVFQTGAQKVLYYVRATGEDSDPSKRQKVAHLLQTMHMHRFQWDFVKRYYLQAQNLIERIYSWQYLILAVIAVVILSGLIACEVYFINDAESQAKSEQTSMFTTNQIISYYDTSIALGMRISYIGFLMGFKYSNTISTVTAQKLSLILQANNEVLKGLTRSTYPLPSLVPNVTYYKPNYDMIVELLSNSYMITQFNDDTFVFNTVISRAQMSLPPIFSKSIMEYQINFLQSQKVIDPNKGDYGVIAGLLVLVVLQCALILRIENRLRLDEQQALNLLLTVNHQDELISSARQFIYKITKEDAVNLRDENEIRGRSAIGSSFAPDSTNRDKEGSASRSQISLREISGRDLIDSFNRSGFLQSAITSRIQPQHQSFALQQKQEVDLTPRKRWMLSICFGLALVIAGISLANQLIYNMGGQINIYQSVSNIFSLFATGGMYSRAMILYLNIVSQGSSGSMNFTDFDNFMTTYNQTQAIVTFPEGAYSEFQPFQNQLSQVTYQYMCTYINCNPLYASEINIIYTTTIQKMLAGAQTWEAKLLSMNATAIANAIKNNGSMARFLDLCYYSETTIRAQLVSLSSLYFNCFNQYSNNLKFKKKILIGITLAATAISLVLIGLLIVYVLRHQGYLHDISGLLKTDSYINEDNQIADREAGKGPQ